MILLMGWNNRANSHNKTPSYTHFTASKHTDFIPREPHHTEFIRRVVSVTPSHSASSLRW